METVDNLLQSEARDKLLSSFRILLALRHAKTDNTPAQITESVYLGSVGAALTHSVLKQIGVTHILTVADNLQPMFPEEFVYKTVDLLDSINQDLIGVLDECIEFIEACVNAGGKILVHCFAGKSRSASVCIAYLMKSQRLTVLEAFQYVREKRHQVMPNTGFMKQLKQYEAILGIQPKFDAN